MRFYFRLLNVGELPRIDVGNHDTFTIKNNEVIVLKGRSIACAYENIYTVKIQGSFGNNEDKIHKWVKNPSIIGLHESIRKKLIDDAYLMNVKTVLVLVRIYSIIPFSNIIYFMAGLIGFNFPFVSSNPSIYGPCWGSRFEEILDLYASGGYVPKELYRYGITPLGKIINPFPPICDKCGMRHFGGNHHQINFSEWTDRFSS